MSRGRGCLKKSFSALRLRALQGFGLQMFSDPGLPEEGGVCRRRDLQPRSGRQERIWGLHKTRGTRLGLFLARLYCTGVFKSRTPPIWHMHGSCTIAVLDTAVVQRRISPQVCTGSPATGATFTFQPHVCKIKSHSYGRQDCTAACGKAGASVNISAVAKWLDAWLRQRCSAAPAVC